ncbi:DUF4238 domain-containing protein [Flavobacterium sp. RS13.1]|uniref:DUF4238 domain-containing protein n=1 Tax=Flavobacterium sp. RS13.1 TaxID=3400345 RepID=UPI003AAE1BA2
METNKSSTKHHYLPVFYLNGFADENQQLFVYDKIKNEILEKQNPSSKFYKNHLNNFRQDGKVLFSFEEKMFTPSDTRVAPLFSRFKNILNYEFSAVDKVEILHFLSQLYWRSPETHEKYIELIKKEGFSNKHFQVSKNGKQLKDEEIPEIINKILNDPETQKMFKHIIPLTNGSIEESKKLFDKWKVIDLTNDQARLITGDNPFLINNKDFRIDNIFEELIFPLSKDKVLILSDESPDFFDSIALVNINILILHQSKRFIASENRNQLETVIGNYNHFKNLNLLDKMHSGTFGIMHLQSQFKNFEDYLKYYHELKREGASH